MINMGMQRNAGKPARRKTVPASPFSHPKIEKAQNAPLGNLINRKDGGEGRKGKGEFPKTSHLSENACKGTAKHRVCAELARGIQMERHVQFLLLLLLLVFLLQHKLLWLDGGINTVHTDHTEPLCKVKTRAPPGKRKLVSGALGCISAHSIPSATHPRVLQSMPNPTQQTGHSGKISGYV